MHLEYSVLHICRVYYGVLCRDDGAHSGSDWMLVAHVDERLDGSACKVIWCWFLRGDALT